MPIDARTARKICTAEELKVVQAAGAGQLEKHSTSQVRALVARARKLSDKWRDKSKRQRGEARGKRAPRKAAPARSADNSEKKSMLFEQTLLRLQARLAVLTTPRRVVSRGTRVSAAPKWIKRKAEKSRTAVTARDESTATSSFEGVIAPVQPPRDKSARIARAGIKRVQSHLAGRNRRQQGRRDSRA